MHIVIGLIMFMFLVLVHEFGHFAVAKLSGIKVNEFSIGMGPALSQFRKNETDYSIRLLPLGGFVSMEGEVEDSEDDRSYKKAKPYKKFLTILAGPLMNLLTAFLIFVLIFSMSGSASRVVDKVEENSPGHIAGLQSGDEIIKVNGKKTYIFRQVIDEIESSKGEEMSLTVKRNSEIVEIGGIKAEEKDGQYFIGFAAKLDKSFLFAINEAFHMVIYVIKMLWNTLIMLFSGKLGMNSLSGPIGVISQVGTAVKMGVSTLLFFLAIISVNLGFFNLLPIPALDGSKLLFITIEKIIGRPINEKLEEYITIGGFLLLMGLILVISYKDILNIFKN